MKRLFTLALGLGAGATAAVLVSRWMRRQAAKVSARHIGEVAAEGARTTGQLFREALRAAKEAAAEREAEIRNSLL